MNSISHSITMKQNSATFGVATNRVYNLPDNRCLLYTQLYNGCEVITIGGEPVMGPDGSKYYKVWVFDKELVFPYKTYLELVYTVFNMGRRDCVFHVDTLMYGGKNWVGVLKVHQSGVVTFDSERIATKQARLLLTKAVMMYG